ncbi:MAG: hypothetical protein P1U58_05675 [Verrucomicrobiales bacterium]|nr:hypothetical protein [Verrucomicrobiales bacterium]
MKTESREALLQCPICRNVLSVNREVMALEDECPVCRSAVDIRAFPRLFREPIKRLETKVADESESACTFFPDLKAEKVCDACGCLMSLKATVLWGGDEVCMPCLHRLREEDKSLKFLPKANLNDNRALVLVTLLAPLSLITAPLALVLFFRHRKEQNSIFPRGRWRWWLALVLAMISILAWTSILIAWASLILEELS